jgi:hypothetical protein
MDGDCTVEASFVQEAVEVLRSEEQVAAVCGWRTEREPTRNPYHRVCDVEWHQGGSGDVGAFGGDVMIRAASFTAANGYDESLIAGEDPELSARLRERGGLIRRLDRTATLHDIDMRSWRQWWRRADRSGYAFAAVAERTRSMSVPVFADETRRAVRWGLVVPVVALLLARPTRGWSVLAVLGRTVLSGVRAARTVDEGRPSADRVAWGLSCALSVYPNVVGIARHFRERRRGERTLLIEYK